MNQDFDVREHNRRAWDKNVDNANQWSVAVDAETIEAARNGDWKVVLTPIKPIPRDWLSAELTGVDILCLASGGGQQGPVLAAAGGNVTVFDNSPRQLAQDRRVAEREGLTITTVEGDMRDLSAFPDCVFDVIVHPVANVFVPNVLNVWREAYRVLRPNGVLLSGFCNPVTYLFQNDDVESVSDLRVTHRIPYSDIDSLTDDEKALWIAESRELAFGHTLDDQIGGQIAAGFAITGFFEDRNFGGLLAEYLPTFIATRALKVAK